MADRESLIAFRFRRGPRSLPKLVYMEHACMGEAFTARMFSENPELPPEAVKAYRWAEEQFWRIATGKVGERDLCG